jgi:hypothetical protein
LKHAGFKDKSSFLRQVQPMTIALLLVCTVVAWLGKDVIGFDEASI